MVPIRRCRYPPAYNTGTLAATGTAPHTATLLVNSSVSDFTGTIAGSQLNSWVAPQLRRMPPRYGCTPAIFLTSEVLQITQKPYTAFRKSVLFVTR